MPARIIALEGIDQSGKRTQTRLLADRLKRASTRVATISFPIYETPSGRQLLRYLKGNREYPPEALHMLYSLNRWENKELINNLVSNSDLLIADRYTPSNLAYGFSKGLSLSWLQGLDKGLPIADLVIVLDVPIVSSFTRKSKNRDVHESNKEFLMRVRRSYKSLSAKLGWRILDATGTSREVHSAIWQTILQRFNPLKRR
ncbi:dTMP kinase [Candidatus Bathyarchaeota archaeon]|nr:MAG: dTMP kinase [Candidatus Bathyarchaeota archaeon]